MEPDTVWTWNAVGKAGGAWGLDRDGNEAQQGFLLNHLIKEELPAATGGRVSNSDPVTGQAGWYDVRVRTYPAAAEDAAESYPQFDPLGPVPGQALENNPGRWLSWFAGRNGKP